MAGHSKWANIQHRKGRQDAARSKLFSKLAKEITVAAKMGDPDPDKNPRLRLAVKEAKTNSVPKDVIQRAIDKSQAAGGDDYEEIRYEGYGPGGVAVIVEAMTDNRNRTASTVRSTFGKHGGNLGETGSVSFMFERKGEIVYPLSAGDEDTVMEAAIEAGKVSTTGGRDLIDAYDMIADTRLEHQAAQIRRGEKPDNFMAPTDLSDFERSHLRDAFVVVKTMQSAAGQSGGYLS